MRSPKPVKVESRLWIGEVPAHHGPLMKPLLPLPVFLPVSISLGQHCLCTNSTRYKLSSMSSTNKCEKNPKDIFWDWIGYPLYVWIREASHRWFQIPAEKSSEESQAGGDTVLEATTALSFALETLYPCDKEDSWCGVPGETRDFVKGLYYCMLSNSWFPFGLFHFNGKVL